uniref:Rho-GAP domain-containing protein n=1 Tax=Kryptolebias marmoratus TaxID=37003 RepID=A0A3Q3ARH9_KRYMA
AKKNKKSFLKQSAKGHVMFFINIIIFLLAVPQVLKSCTEFIEKHGVVDGIYRLSGIASNIQKLR